MKKIQLLLLITGLLNFTACSNEKSGINNESGSAGNEAANDSSTTNPVNSEHGTHNSSESMVDSVKATEQ